MNKFNLSYDVNRSFGPAWMIYGPLGTAIEAAHSEVDAKARCAGEISSDELRRRNAVIEATPRTQGQTP